jgi:hypothetical protein
VSLTRLCRAATAGKGFTCALINYVHLQNVCLAFCAATTPDIFYLARLMSRKSSGVEEASS